MIADSLKIKKSACCEIAPPPPPPVKHARGASGEALICSMDLTVSLRVGLKKRTTAPGLTVGPDIAIFLPSRRKPNT